MLSVIERKEKIIFPHGGFDIETTTGEKGAYMYIAMYNDPLHRKKSFRTWNEVFNFFDELIADYERIEPFDYLVVMVHNLQFEWQFVRRLVPFSSIFAKSNREVLKARYKKIEFRDSLAITGCSLDKTVKLYNLPVTKKIGQLDYSLKRNSKTVLTPKELDYCFSDVEILTELSVKLCNTYIREHGYFPLTKTGILRHEVRELSQDKLFNNYRHGVRLSYPSTLEKYQVYMTWLFSGGITQANANYTNILLTTNPSNELADGRLVEEVDGVWGYDIKSDYPYQMATFNYPIGKPTKVKEPTENTLFELMEQGRHVIAFVEFTDIEIKPHRPISFLSKSKALQPNDCIFANGKLYKGKSVCYWVTELDYQIIKDTYSFTPKFIFMEHYYSRRLPSYIVQPVLDGFIEKEKIGKDGEGYALAKQKPNSGFGMLCTKECIEELMVNDLGDVVVDTSKEYDYNKTVRKAYLSPLHGVYVTSYARYTLMNMINKIGDDVVYCDTDSIYFINHDKHVDMIERYNDRVREHNKTHLPRECWELGTFSNEGRCTKFMTLGSKRYIYRRDGHVKTTVSGMKKDSLRAFCADKKISMFDAFSDGLILNTIMSNKTTAKYHDTYHEEIIVDYQGNEELMSSESSVSIEDTTFSMSLAPEYLKFFTSLQAIRRNSIYEKR